MVCKVMLKGLQGDVLCSRHEHNHGMMIFLWKPLSIPSNSYRIHGAMADKGQTLLYTPLKFKIITENWWFEDYFPMVTFQGLC